MAISILQYFNNIEYQFPIFQYFNISIWHIIAKMALQYMCVPAAYAIIAICHIIVNILKIPVHTCITRVPVYGSYAIPIAKL